MHSRRTRPTEHAAVLGDGASAASRTRATIHLTPHAAADLRDACDVYARADPALPDRFLVDVDLVVERILTFPHGATPVAGHPDPRRARMRHFPFGVFYRVEEAGEVTILRVPSWRARRRHRRVARQARDRPLPRGRRDHRRHRGRGPRRGRPGGSRAARRDEGDDGAVTSASRRRG